MQLGICENCKKEKKIHFNGLSKNLCNWCYRKLIWKPKLIKCNRCERIIKHHGKGLCAGCYNSTYHIDKVKLLNAKRRHNIEPNLYKEFTKECMVCGFDKLVDLHHLDHNNQNNSSDNLIGLCPNHHKMLHSKKYQQGIFNTLKKKGFKIPERGYKTDGFIRIPHNTR